MNKLLTIIFFFGLTLHSFGQEDGTDILPVKVKDLDKSYTGRLAHIEYIKNGAGFNDTITLMVNNAAVPFVSRRVGNGLDGRFYGQYLESAGYIDGYKVRLVKSRIDAVTGRHIMLTNYFDFYSKSNALMAGKSVTQQYQVNKKDINQVLVKVDKMGT